MNQLLVTASFAQFISFATAAGSSDTCECTTDPMKKYYFYSGPNLRSTTDIIWTCLSTLFICLWASLHLNIPATNDTYLTATLRQMKWMAYAIFAPEVLTFTAVVQWLEARHCSRQMQELGHPWTVTHGFFANMGGFTVLLPEISTPHTLDGDELYAYIRDGRLPCPDISRDAINDRSKADALVKAIACFQASWLLLQSIARTIQGLPVTTLELATIAYVVCALVNYLCWWSKPLNVCVAVHLGALQSPSLGEAVQLQIGSTTPGSVGDLTTPRQMTPELSPPGCRATPPSPTGLDPLSLVERVTSNIELQSLNAQNRAGEASTTAANAHPRFHPSWDPFDNFIEPSEIGLQESRSTGNVSVPTKHETQESPTHQQPVPHIRSSSPTTQSFAISRADRHGPTDRIRNKLSLNHRRSSPAAALALMTGVIFGSIHCAAWHFDFPSPSEQIMWRLSSLMLPLCSLIYPVAEVMSVVLLIISGQDTKQNEPWATGEWVLWYGALALYGTTRLYLVLEPFVALREQAGGVYQTVDWTKFVGHL